MKLFPQQGPLEWIKFGDNQFDPGIQDWHVCNYYCFILIVNYRSMVGDKTNPTPYYPIVHIPEGKVDMQKLNEEYNVIQNMDKKMLITLWDSENPFPCFATLQEAKDHCVKIVNLYLHAMKGIPMIEEKPPTHSESRKEGDSHGKGEE